MHAQRPLKTILTKTQTYWSLLIIELDNIRINSVETFQGHRAGDLIIFNPWIVNINNICSETKRKEIKSTVKQLAVRNTFFWFWIAHIFSCQKYLHKQNVPMKHFNSDKAAFPGGRYSGQKNLSTKCTPGSVFDYTRIQCSFKCLKCKISPAWCIALDWEVN